LVFSAKSSPPEAEGAGGGFETSGDLRLEKNQYAAALVQNEVALDDLFA